VNLFIIATIRELMMKSAYAKASADAVSTKSILPMDRMPLLHFID